MSRTNIRPSYIVFLLYLLMSTQPISGLEEPLTLCETQGPVTVRDLSGGTIQHVQRTAGGGANECQLVLTGFSSSAYVSLPGVEKKEGKNRCSDDRSEITVNGESHCVKESAEGVIIALTNGILTLKSKKRTKSFTLDYYSNVAVCNEDASTTIPPNAAHDQLSCIIANYDIASEPCSTTIRNLTERTIKLELLYITPGTGKTATFKELEITKANPIILFNPGDELVITYGQEGSAPFRYVIKLTVLTCKDVPHVQNATNDASPGPWFSGSQVSYTCSEEGYEFRDASSVTCQLESTNQSLEWSKSSDITCIPAPRCLKPMKMLSNTDVNQSRDNLTATYQCVPGYLVSSGPEKVTVTCSSPDPDTVPWTWNDTDIQLKCTRVECSLTDIKRNITNSKVTQKDRYYYQDILSYTCGEGYVKNGSVTCQADASWSAESQCETEKQPAPRCIKPMKMLSNTYVNWSRDNLTATYKCVPGYLVSSGPGQVTVTCNSSDSDTVPWTWNDTDIQLNCTRVECSLTDIKRNITNRKVAQKDRYYYQDILSYVCGEGYVKNGYVTCQADASWSAESQCETEKQSGNELTEPPLNIDLIAGSTGGSAALIALIIVLVVVVCKKRRPAPSASTADINKEAVADTTGQSMENLYFELEPPDVMKVHTARPTTEQYEEVSAGPCDIVELDPGDTRKPTTVKQPLVKGDKPGTKRGKLAANSADSQSKYTEIYDEVHPMKLTHHQPPPSLYESPDPVYGDDPAVYAKLEGFSGSSGQSKAEEVIMVDNGLYDAAGGRYGSA